MQQPSQQAEAGTGPLDTIPHSAPPPLPDEQTLYETWPKRYWAMISAAGKSFNQMASYYGWSAVQHASFIRPWLRHDQRRGVTNVTLGRYANHPHRAQSITLGVLFATLEASGVDLVDWAKHVKRAGLQALGLPREQLDRIEQQREAAEERLLQAFRGLDPRGQSDALSMLDSLFQTSRQRAVADAPEHLLPNTPISQHELAASGRLFEAELNSWATPSAAPLAGTSADEYTPDAARPPQQQPQQQPQRPAAPDDTGEHKATGTAN